MRKFIGLLICSLVLASCNLFEGTGVDFEVKNNTERTLNRVQVKTNHGSKTSVFNKIAPGKSVSGFLKINGDKADGNYILKFERENEEIERVINEYFSDGTAMSHKIIFEIEDDTVYFNTEHYY